MKTMKLNLLEKEEMNETRGGVKYTPCHTTMGSCGLSDYAKADLLENQAANNWVIPYEEKVWLHEWHIRPES